MAAPQAEGLRLSGSCPSCAPSFSLSRCLSLSLTDFFLLYFPNVMKKCWVWFWSGILSLEWKLRTSETKTQAVHTCFWDGELSNVVHIVHKVILRAFDENRELALPRLDALNFYQTFWKSLVRVIIASAVHFFPFQLWATLNVQTYFWEFDYVSVFKKEAVCVQGFGGQSAGSLFTLILNEKLPTKWLN